MTYQREGADQEFKVRQNLGLGLFFVTTALPPHAELVLTRGIEAALCRSGSRFKSISEKGIDLVDGDIIMKGWDERRKMCVVMKEWSITRFHHLCRRWICVDSEVVEVSRWAQGGVENPEVEVLV